MVRTPGLCVCHWNRVWHRSVRILLHLYHHKLREGCKTCSGYIKTLSPSVSSLYVPPVCEATFALFLLNFFRHRRLCQFSFRSAIFAPALSTCSSFLILLFWVWFLPEFNFSLFFSHVGCSIQCPFPTSLHISKKQYTYLSTNNHNS